MENSETFKDDPLFYMLAKPSPDVTGFGKFED